MASVVFAGVEIPNKAKVALGECLTIQSGFYFLILAFANVVTTLLAIPMAARLVAPASVFFPIILAAVGVFGFEVIVRQTNVTMFGRGVLTVQDWIDRALNGAAATAIARQEDRRSAFNEKLANKLRQLTDQEINTRALDHLGAAAVAKLNEEAAASQADPKLYKIFQLVASLSRSEALALLR